MKFHRVLLVLLVLMLALPAFSDKRVLGKLGQATERTPIFASMSKRSRIYYHVKQYEYLVINPTRKSGWMRVLLQNGSNGYVPAETVARLPYEVTIDAPTSRMLGSATSRGQMANYSKNFVGTPYVWGGNDTMNGIDCSGFVKKMYGANGIDLPRTASEQVKVGLPITRLEDLQPGDRLYFWEKKRGKIGHTGIYLGGGYFVHSSRGHNGVATDYLGSKKWLRILVAARR